ncbi:622_t:CDS:2, partial [Cetraspora pellucida]
GHKEEVLCKKHRKTKVHSPDLCHAKIRVLRFINEQKEEAIKNYLSPVIVNAIKEHATRRLDLGASVKELKKIEDYNIKKKIYKSEDSHFI